jgi:predicted Rossmann fold flavoprotein
MDSLEAIIIGGGPAGLMAAICCREPGTRIIVLEKNGNAGRKLLISGSGQCNLTRTDPVIDFLPHYGDHGSFLRTAFSRFDNDALMDFFRKRDLALEAREDGKVFPASRRADDVLKILLNEASLLGIPVRTGNPAAGLERSGDQFVIRTKDGAFASRFCLLATGGKSYPGTGSTGDGYALASALGHTVIRPKPALVQLDVNRFAFSRLSGISISPALVSLYRNGKKTREARDDLLFTHKGFSGPVILNLSRYVEPGDSLGVCFIPGITRKGYEGELLDHLAVNGKTLVSNLVSGPELPKRFVESLLEAEGIPADRAAHSLDREERTRLLNRLFDSRFPIEPPSSFRTAMVTAGGIDLKEIDPRTMESRIVAGLFFAGEVMDVDGDTGGYNLQAAFSTGALAGSVMRGRIRA